MTFKTKDTSGIDGGVFKSVNMGNVWAQKAAIPTKTGKPDSIQALNVSVLAMDPSDHNALYYGGIGSGLYYTYNGGEDWLKITNFGDQTIRSIAVDPTSKCIIYISIAHKVFLTTDCGRTWKDIYTDNNPQDTVDVVALDQYDPKIIYIALSRGDIVKSTNRGEGWQIINRTGDRINNIVVNPADSRKIYLLTANHGIVFSTNGGETWEALKTLNDKLNELQYGQGVQTLKIIPTKPNIMFVTTQYGLLKTEDGGTTWNKIDLIPPQNQATINSFEVNPQNPNELYYVTNTTFYRSLDGGATWKTIQMPTTRMGKKLLIDFINPVILYLGVQGAPK